MSNAAPAVAATPKVSGPNFYLCSQVSTVNDDELRRMAAACQLHAATELCPTWDLLAPTITPVSNVSEIPADGIGVLFLADIGDPQAAAYHSVNAKGVPMARVLATPGMAMSDIEDSCSHEIWEALADLYCSDWMMHTNADGTSAVFYAKEIADAVEGLSFTLDIGSGAPVTMSNWCTPWWFQDGPPAGVKFDYMGQCTTAWQIMEPDGYAVTIAGGQTTTLPLGRALPASKSHPLARTQRRMAHAVRCGVARA